MYNYDTTIQPTFTPQINSAYSIRVKKDLVQYLHAAAFCPAPKTWVAAIKQGLFSTWPGLTEKLVAKHLHKSGATVRGRQTRIRQNIRSTQLLQEDIDTPEVVADVFPVQKDSENIISLAIMDPRNMKHGTTGVIYSDITGKFPYPSSKGNQYIMVMYDWDSNAILGEPMKNRTKEEIVRAIQQLYKYLKSRGISPKLHILDNEASKKLKQCITTNNTKYQLAPPSNHRTNAAENAYKFTRTILRQEFATWTHHAP